MTQITRHCEIQCCENKRKHKQRFSISLYLTLGPIVPSACFYEWTPFRVLPISHDVMQTGDVNLFLILFYLFGCYHSSENHIYQQINC